MLSFSKHLIGTWEDRKMTNIKKEKMLEEKDDWQEIPTS